MRLNLPNLCRSRSQWWGFCTTRSLLGPCHRRVGASCSAIPPSGGRGGVRTCRGPGGWTLRLAVLTRRCAAKPYWWHGGQPAQATTSRVNVRIKGRSCPPAEPVSLLGANPRRVSPLLPLPAPANVVASTWPGPLSHNPYAWRPEGPFLAPDRRLPSRSGRFLRAVLSALLRAHPTRIGTK